MRTQHPDSKSLALHAAGDLPPIARWRARFHISLCRACAEQVSEYRDAILQARREACAEALPALGTGARWSRLEREMIGNIAVGVAAARCIDKVGRQRRVFSAGAVVATAAAALFAAGWMTHIPREQNEDLVASLRRLVGLASARPAGTIVQTTANGIAVKTQGVTLRLIHPPSAEVFLAGSSAITARYVDQDTGQVMITNVYGQ